MMIDLSTDELQVIIAKLNDAFDEHPSSDRFERYRFQALIDKLERAAKP